MQRLIVKHIVSSISYKYHEMVSGDTCMKELDVEQSYLRNNSAIDYDYLIC
jgi:hypothetical protein